MHRISLLFALALLLCAAPARAATPIQFEDPEFESRTLVSGLTQPSAVDWTPDGRTVIAEKDGRVKVAAANGTVDPNPSHVLDISNQVNSFGDRGLLGIAVDSDFATNRYVYVLYTRDITPLTPDSTGPMVSRLSRFQLAPDNTWSTEAPILGTYPGGPCPAPANDVDCMPSDSLSHSIGTVRADPDGTLWVGTGDGAEYNTMDRRALRTYNNRSLAGKILHVDREGRGLPSHAFDCGDDDNLTHVCTKLHSKGFRNPFRFTLRPGGGLAVGDVGWNTREEVDLIDAGGKSYGWPCYEGTIHTPQYQELGACAKEYAKEGTPDAHLGPIHDFPHSGQSAAVVGGPEYDGGPYPAVYAGSIFFADFARGAIRRLVPDGEGGYDSQDFARGLTDADGHAVVFLGRAPDNGDVVYVDMSDFSPGAGSINRIRHAPDNRAPIAAAAASPPYGKPAPLEVTLDGSASSDPDGDELTYEWDFGDGSPVETGAEVTHTYAEGTYTARLVVSDGGKTDMVTLRIDSGNTPPEITVTPPPGGYRNGEPFTVTASATDGEDSPAEVPADRFSWDVRLVHGSHSHPNPSLSGDDEIEIVPGDDHDADSHLEVTVRATDSQGLASTKQVRIDPQTIPLALTSSPPGAPLEYAGFLPRAAPFFRVAAIGFRTTISAGERFTSGGRTWAFSSWSDGGERLHDITIPDSPFTLTARYRDITPPKPKPPPPPPPLPPGDDGGDEANPGPAISFSGLRRGSVRGTAVDPDGVAKVYVAVGRRRRGKCRWWFTSLRRLSRRRYGCDRPKWIRAKLVKGRWKASLRRRRIPAASYRVLFRAVDKKGNESRHLVDSRSFARVQVRRRRG